MSVQRVALSRYVPSGAVDGKGVWVATFSEMLDELEARAGQDGIALDWDSLEVETEAGFEEMRTLTGDGQQIRHTSLHLAALGLTAPAADE